jgi:hypothetical protein
MNYGNQNKPNDPSQIEKNNKIKNQKTTIQITQTEINESAETRNSNLSKVTNKCFLFGFLPPEYGTVRLSQNVGNKSPLLAV